MPFMYGKNPLRRTFYYLQQGNIKFRDNVSVFSMGYDRKGEGPRSGVKEFVFWHWAQLQFHNPNVQLVKHVDKVITPYAKAFMRDGREVLFDLEGLSREEIENELIQTLGKTELVRKRESLEKMAKLNPASFGTVCERQCMCEVQGQHPCTALLHSPQVMTGKY
ncbi:hypothetical protein PENTCL1PPCAC_17925, partial [Pristionchus entomophagus]